MNYGQALRLLRDKYKLTQEQVCEKIHKKQGYYSGLENNHFKPSIDMLENLAEAFNIPLNILIWLAMEKSDLKHLKSDFKSKMDKLTNEFIKNE